MLNRIFATRSFLAPKSATTNTSLITRTLKIELPVVWVRPGKLKWWHPSKSGDRSPTAEVDKSAVAIDYQLSEELKNAEPDVRKQFTLEYQTIDHIVKYKVVQMRDSVKRHIMDESSPEAKIAEMTARIRHMQELRATKKRNGRRNKILKEMIDRRYKYLNRLRRTDYKCYEWILEKLDLQFKPPPMELFQITRKDSLRRLTNIHCDNIKNTRLDVYRKQLEAEQLPFLGEKLKNMEFLRAEQLDLGIEVTVTEDDIANVRKTYEEMKAKAAENATDEDGDGDSTRKWKSY